MGAPQGKEEDVEVGLTYFGKRYLNPLLGRWVSPDPLAVHVPGEADWNLYAYVSGSVLRLVDPFGLQDEPAQTTQAHAPIRVSNAPAGVQEGQYFAFIPGETSRTVSQAEIQKLAAEQGVPVFQYASGSSVTLKQAQENIDAFQAIANMRQALQESGTCTGTCTGGGDIGGYVGPSYDVALAGGMLEGGGPVAGGKKYGNVGGGAESAEGSETQQALIGAGQVADNVNVAGGGAAVAGKAAKKLAAKTTAKRTRTAVARALSRTWPKHHPFPKYLGGAAEQTLKKLPRRLHYKFHSALDKWMGGKYARSKGAAHFKGIDRKTVLRDLREFYEKAEGGAFKKYLKDFDQAVRESVP